MKSLLVHDRLTVVFVALNAPGYQSSAAALLREALKADVRLPELWIKTFDLPDSIDPWWAVYQILELDPAPDVLCFPVYCWNAEKVYDIARMVRTLRPGAKIVLGGPEVGPQASQVLSDQPAVDAVIAGEGERALGDLLLSYAREGDPAGIAGVSVRDSATGAVTSTPMQPIENLDSIPSCYTPQHQAPIDGTAYLETFRGCPHECGYCYEAKGSTRIRAFSWERVSQEVASLVATPGLYSFTFIDSVFNLTPRRLEKMTEIMEPHAQRGVRLHTIEVDIEAIDATQADQLKRCGVVSVETGPQSVNPATLAACNRTLDKERYRAGVAACRAAGIVVEADLIIGLPKETPESLQEAFEFVLSCDPGRLQVSTLHVLPGTPLMYEAEQYGVVFNERAPHEVMATPTFSFGELRAWEALGVALGKLYRARTDA